jgi:hypothetical protein
MPLYGVRLCAHVVLLCINVGVGLHDFYHFLHLRAHSTVGTTMPSNGSIPGMSVYGKRYALNQRVIAQYENKSIKTVWFERAGGGKCYLASGQPTKNFTHMLYKTAIAVKLEEMQKIVECLGKATCLPDSVNYYEISETTDWNGDRVRLLLKDSEYQGLMLCRLKARKEDIEMIGPSDDDEEDGGDSDNTIETDPEPVEKISFTME